MDPTEPRPETPSGPVDDDAFDAWIETLRAEVVERDHGYERGEFTVFPELWRSAFDEGLSPSDAFARSLRDADTARDVRNAARKAERARIDAADAASAPGSVY